MTTRITKLFEVRNKEVLAIYCTAGFPFPEDTMQILMYLQQSGADIVEIGIPYSDPVADGEVIQQSNKVALTNGMNIGKLFSQLTGCRESFQLPLVLMGYMNPVMQYGFERFCKDAADAGVDGVILPDLPPAEYEKNYRKFFDQYGLNFILLITPETSAERIRYIDNISSGFIYAVSSSSTTGSTAVNSINQEYLKRIAQMKLKNPVMVGFGIHDRETFLKACEFSNGAIIGSAFVKAVSGRRDLKAVTEDFLKFVQH